MKEVVYSGVANVRILTAANIERMGLEQKKDFEFHRGEPQEVSNQLGDLLVRSGEFDYYEAPPAAEVEDESSDASASSDEGSGEEGSEEHADA